MRTYLFYLFTYLLLNALLRDQSDCSSNVRANIFYQLAYHFSCSLPAHAHWSAGELDIVQVQWFHYSQLL